MTECAYDASFPRLLLLSLASARIAASFNCRASDDTLLLSFVVDSFEETDDVVLFDVLPVTADEFVFAVSLTSMLLVAGRLFKLIIFRFPGSRLISGRCVHTIGRNTASARCSHKTQTSRDMGISIKSAIELNNFNSLWLF